MGWFTSRTPGRHSGHRQIFREADADESGDLDREELRIALRGPASLAPRKTNYDEFYWTFWNGEYYSYLFIIMILFNMMMIIIVIRVHLMKY